MTHTKRTRHVGLAVVVAVAGAAALAGCIGPPEGLVCTAEAEGNFLDWEPGENATAYNVYRNSTAGWTLIGTTADTEFLDSDVEPGVTYEYEVRSVAPDPRSGEPVESEPAGCSVTAVPFFPGVAWAAAAGALGVALLVGMRARRRA